jgi:hypothetical protein
MPRGTQGQLLLVHERERTCGDAAAAESLGRDLKFQLPPGFSHLQENPPCTPRSDPSSLIQMGW